MAVMLPPHPPPRRLGNKSASPVAALPWGEAAEALVRTLDLVPANVTRERAGWVLARMLQAVCCQGAPAGASWQDDTFLDRAFASLLRATQERHLWPVPSAQLVEVAVAAMVMTTLAAPEGRVRFPPSLQSPLVQLLEALAPKKGPRGGAR
eukprot:1734747-Pyramimonas_sp.AAC.1